MSIENNPGLLRFCFVPILLSFSKNTKKQKKNWILNLDYYYNNIIIIFIIIMIIIIIIIIICVGLNLPLASHDPWLDFCPEKEW